MPSNSELAPEDLPEPRVGSIIGERYRIEALLDQGAMGRVYRGEHIHMRKRVAIKILRRELTRVPEVLARFEREAMAAANINHQHVAAATDFGKLQDGSVYLVLEYVEGRTLRKELSSGALSVHRALNIASQIADALTAAHDLDIVHRDLKPENVMLVQRGADRDYVKVLDFGVAKVPVDIAEAQPDRRETGSLITKAGMVFGTPDYMAPEQALGQSVDYRADLYSLGVVLYEMLAGVRPFRGDHELGVLGQQLSKGVPPMALRAPNIDVPERVEAFVRALMVNEASERVANASITRDGLTQLLRTVPDSLPPARFSPPESSPASTLGVGSQLGVDTQRRGVLAAALWSQFGHWRSRSGELRELFRRAFTAASRRLGALSRRLPEPLNLLPVWVLLVVPVVFLSGVIALTLALASGPDLVAASEPGSAPSVELVADVTAAQIERALAAGTDEVGALVESYPQDARVWLAQARALVTADEYVAATEAIRQLLELAPEYANNKFVAGVLWKTAQVPISRALTFDLLQGPMKSRGADIIYDLAVTPGVKPAVAQPARTWLNTRAFEKISTPEASVAAALLLAPSCAVRAALAKRAENVGDQRSLVLLKEFQQGQGCLPSEPKPCNSCLRGNRELKSAITKLSEKATK